MSPVSCMSPLEITFWAWNREFPELHLCSCAYHLVLISLLFLFPVPVTSSCSTADIGSFDLKPFFNFFLYVFYPKDSSSVAWNSHGSPLFLFLPLILIMASLLGVLWFITCIRHQNASPALQTLCLEQCLAFTWCSADSCRTKRRGTCFFFYLRSSLGNILKFCCLLLGSLFLFLLHCRELEPPNSNTDLALWGASFCDCLLRWHN